MEKEIVWTLQAQDDFWEIVTYLKECWPPQVLDKFEQSLIRKSILLIKHPHLGFKSKKHSRLRRTLLTKHYLLIYTVKKEHVVFLRLKHVSMK
jgi:plasmid stabilization system protein ParE